MFLRIVRNRLSFKSRDFAFLPEAYEGFTKNGSPEYKMTGK